LEYIGNAHTPKRAVHISCSTVGCTVEIRVAAVRHTQAWCERHAIDKWNARHTPPQIPQATRERYEEYKQLRELSNYYGEKQKSKMFMQEIRKVLADFGLRIEDNNIEEE